MFPSDTRSSDWLRTLILIAVALAVGTAAITRQSLWMDEGGPAFKALMPTLKEWWQMTLRMPSSDVQMPVYMPAVWAWEKVFGDSEYALRAINLPFLAIMAVALRKVRFWPLVCLTSPFVLYYVGELRPYAMQLAAGAWAAAALRQIIHNPAKDLRGLNALYASAIFLCASSLTAVIWAGGLILGALVIRPDWLKNKQFWLRSLLWFPAALALGGYYVFTLIGGYRAAALGGGGVLSIFFGFYEMAGLLGLGPSRNELRASPSALIQHLPWILPATACLFAAWLCGLRQWLQSISPRAAIGVAVAVVLPVLILAVVGIVADFRVLGRHLSPAMPAVLLPFCLCLSSATHRKPQLIIGTLAILISLTSAAFLRLDPRHARDDFRSATTIALDALAKNQSVLWQADICTPYYYAFRKGGWPLVHVIQVLYTNRPSGTMFADVIVINRPDLSYKNRDHEALMKRDAFELDTTFTGFQIWKNRYSTGN